MYKRQYVATQVGFGSSWQNPFGLAVAQGIAGIPVMSGAWFRIPLWIFFTVLTIVFTMRYAVKIKKNPTMSVAVSYTHLRTAHSNPHSPRLVQLFTKQCTKRYIDH